MASAATTPQSFAAIVDDFRGAAAIADGAAPAAVATERVRSERRKWPTLAVVGTLLASLLATDEVAEALGLNVWDLPGHPDIPSMPILPGEVLVCVALFIGFLLGRRRWLQDGAPVQSRRGRKYAIATGLACLALAFFWSFYVSPDPARAGFTHLPTMPFFSALCVAALLAGGGATWTVVIGAPILQAIVLPPAWSFAMKWDYLPYFVEFGFTMAVCAGCLSIVGGGGLPQASLAQRARKLAKLAGLYRRPQRRRMLPALEIG